MNFSTSVGASILAALLGDQLWFELGRRRGRQMLGWLCLISFEPMSCVRRTEEFFAHHGVCSLMIAKFIPGLSTIAATIGRYCGSTIAAVPLVQRYGHDAVGGFRRWFRSAVQQPA